MVAQVRKTPGWRAGSVYRLSAEAFCPLIIFAIVFDAASRVVWEAYADRDVQIYATIARFWSAGFIPYRDLYDSKPPLIFVALRAGYALWGYGPQSLWRVTLLLTATGALVMYVGLRRAGWLTAAPLTSLGFLTLVVADPGHLVSQNTELLAVAFGAAAFGCAAGHQRSERWWWAVGSGICVGLATLGKQPAVLWALPVGVQVCLSGPRRNWWSGVRSALLLATGFSAVLVCAVGYFAWYGAAKSLYEAVIVDGSQYAGLGTVSWTSLLVRPPARLLLEMIGNERMWPFIGAVIIFVPLTIAAPSRQAWVTWLWLLTSYIAVVCGPREYYHYLILSFPALAITVGIAFEFALGDVPAQHARRLVAATLIAIFAYGGIWHASYPPPRLSLADEAQTRAEGLRIRAAAKPGDTLFVSDEPFHLYVYAEMPPMTRIIHPDAPTPGAPVLWASALERRPTFIAVSRSTQGWLARPEGFETRLAQLLSEEYEAWIDDPNRIVYRSAAMSRVSTAQCNAPVVRPFPAEGCSGDCDGDGNVTIDELITGTCAVLGDCDASACPTLDANLDGRTTVDEIVKGVSNALTGCPGR